MTDGRLVFADGRWRARCGCGRAESFYLLSAAMTWLEACGRHEPPHAPAPTRVPPEPVRRRE